MNITTFPGYSVHSACGRLSRSVVIIYLLSVRLCDLCGNCSVKTGAAAQTLISQNEPNGTQASQPAPRVTSLTHESSYTSTENKDLHYQPKNPKPKRTQIQAQSNVTPDPDPGASAGTGHPAANGHTAPPRVTPVPRFYVSEINPVYPVNPV